MPCTLRLRKDDIPKLGKEKSYACDTCGALIFAERKPRCREKMLAEVRARHASAMAETDHLDHKGNHDEKTGNQP